MAAIEGLHWIRTGRLASLSAQQHIDCAKVEDRRSPRQAFKWVKDNGGITSEVLMPIRGQHTIALECAARSNAPCNASARSGQTGLLVGWSDRFRRGA